MRRWPGSPGEADPGPERGPGSGPGGGPEFPGRVRVGPVQKLTVVVNVILRGSYCVQPCFTCMRGLPFRSWLVAITP